MSSTAELNLQTSVDLIWAERSVSPAATLRQAQELLESHVKQLTTGQLMKLHTAIAVGHTSQNRLPEALKAAEAAENQRREHLAVDPEVNFELRRVHGRQALLTNREVEVLKLTLKNIEEAAASGNERLLALAHSDAAAAYGVAGNLRKALEHLQQSLQRTTEADHTHYGALLNNLGNVYLLLKRAEEAIACFVKARKAFTVSDNDLMLGITLSNEARALEALGQIDRSLALHAEALSAFRAGGYGHYVAASLYKTGNALATAGRFSEAEAHYLESLALMDEPDSAGYEDDAREAYGLFLLRLGRPEEAAEQFIRCVEIGQSGSTSLTAAKYLQSLIEAQEAAGQTDAALASIKQLVALRDSMDHDPARTSSKTEIIELEQSLERELELVRVTASALVEANRRLADQSKELAELATTDHLTNLRNRRYFTQKLESAIWGMRKSDTNFSVIFLDVDAFKLVNDTYGHETGDLVLQELARIFRSSVRESDVVARWGGEEFALLLNGADSSAAVAVAEKLHAGVNEFEWTRLAGELTVTISAGVISSSDHPQATADDLMRIADELLYSAKLAGRNRIVMAQAGQAAGGAA